MSRRAWFRIHSFTGVITGLMLFVICWSGTFTVFAHELDWLVTPQVRVQPGERRVSWGEIRATVQRAYPESEVTELRAPRHRRAAAKVRLNRPRQNDVWAYVNPYTGELRGTTSGFTLHQFFRTFHVELMHLGGQGLYIGYFIVLAFSLVLMASLGSALVFYRRWWEKFFSFSARTARQFWSSLHSLAGLWSVWFLILMAVTGGWYTYEMTHWYFGGGTTSYAGAGNPSWAERGIPLPEHQESGSSLPLDQLVNRIRTIRPDLTINSLRLNPGQNLLMARGQADNWLVRDWANRVYLNTRTGELLYNQRAEDLSPYWRWVNTADPLHYGTFAGWISKTIWFLFGLILCGIILSGTYLHTRRLAKKQFDPPRHRWPGTRVALLVGLVLLTLTIPYGLETLRSYGPTVNGVQRYPTVPAGVQAVVFSWVGLTVGIITFWVGLLCTPNRFTAQTKPADLDPKNPHAGSANSRGTN